MTKLEKLLKYVSENNEFYKNIIREYGITDPLDITQYPILTRQQLQENRYDMFSDGYKAKYFSQQLRRQSSSGSSGRPVNVYWDYKDYNASMLTLWRLRLNYYGISPTDKVIKFIMSDMHLKSIDDGQIKYYNESRNSICVNRLSLNCEEKYFQLIKMIEEYKPKWLYIQPSVLRKLLYAYKKFGYSIPQSICYIESVGEFLDDKLRKSVLDFFGVTVARMYGSEEMNGIAFECPFHNLHVLEDNVYLEVKNEQKITLFGEGEVILTNVKSKGMPLIRYNQGDKVRIENELTRCDCGNSSKVIAIIYGRTQNCFCVGSREINSLMLTGIITEINNVYFDMILEFHFCYMIKSRILKCYIVIAENNINWFEQISNSIKERLIREIPASADMIFEVYADKMNYSGKKHQILEIEEGHDE